MAAAADCHYGNKVSNAWRALLSAQNVVAARSNVAARWDGTRAMLPSNLWVGQRVGENLLVLFSLEAMQLNDTRTYAAELALGNVSDLN